MLGSGGVRKFSLRRASADEKSNKAFEMSHHINDPGSERTTKTRFCCVHELFSFLLARGFHGHGGLDSVDEEEQHKLHAFAIKTVYGRREAFY